VGEDLVIDLYRHYQEILNYTVTSNPIEEESPDSLQTDG